ncbi:unnamed protein product [Rotaria socialis]|uniref:Uncharacterized protein n=1 Tax=Rotaria socialis TaxID=392032 RepID=A0A818VM98_9BILA|nr:unnamed protein product [Rotaria socialis]CAF3392173.1 unnamed protein product [Rotaria socialis]CAF3440631.1 unnamed protein product [Rotaria socialis]CAF3644849.1 unnamed protein product [Rotaria socialis]CAF3712960.1 unnamed protein product [Rotaria socialis]
MTLPPSPTSTHLTGTSSILSVSYPQFTRNASCPTQRTLALTIDKKYSSSSNTLHTYFNQTNQRSNTIPAQHSTILENENILQRIKTRVVNLFKRVSNGNSLNNKDLQMDLNQQPLSTFNYDPELDLREEHLSLVSKRLLTTLRESKIKHLSCDNLFLPCNHIRNIARQCLIMSAEEPFGIMGAQIKIKLTLLSPNMTKTITKYLPVIQINPKQKTTFEIEIDLHEDTKVFTLRHFLPQMKMFQQIKERSPLYVSPRCLLIKNVFYKTAEPKRALVNSS